MMLSQPGRQQRLLTNPERVLSLIAPEKEETVLEITDTAAFWDFLEEGEQVMEVLKEVMNSVCNIYDTDVRDLEEPIGLCCGKAIGVSKLSAVRPSLQREAAERFGKHKQ